MQKFSAVKSRKYTLFPKVKKTPTLQGGEKLHTATPFSIESDQNAIKDEQAGGCSDVSQRIIDSNVVQRHKITFPKFGQLATIEEVDTDSPTIQGMQKIPKDPCSQTQPASLTTPQQNTYESLLLSNGSGLKLQPGDKIPVAKPCETADVNKFPGSLGGETPGANPALLANTAPILVTESLVNSHHPTNLRSSRHRSRTMLHADNRASNVRPGNASCVSKSIVRHRPGGIAQVASGNESLMKCKESDLVQNSGERAFEGLPKGWKPREAASKLNMGELMAVCSQAVREAGCFEVLRMTDVETLSKELRYLDGRAEYLRHTYKSLRSGRCGLQQSRKCYYPRPIQITRSIHESMLRREEDLAKLDASIDDWFTRLEETENRRTRIRQKLLEHIAAATILFVPECYPCCINDSLQHDMGTQLSSQNITTTYPGPDVALPNDEVAGFMPSRRLVTLTHRADWERLAASHVADDTDIKVINSTARRDKMESAWTPPGSDIVALLDNLEKEVLKTGNRVNKRTRNSRLERNSIERERLRSYNILCGEIRQDNRSGVTICI